MGVPENERTTLQRAMLTRAAALAAAQRGAPWKQAHEADEALRHAFAVLYARVAQEAGLPLGALTDAQAQTFLAGLLCTGADASASERGLAARSSLAAVTAMREAEPAQQGRVTAHIALMVLASMRRGLQETSGVLAFDDALSMHRAAGLVFSTPDVACNVRRARLVAQAVQGASFESMWDSLRDYESKVTNA